MTTGYISVKTFFCQNWPQKNHHHLPCCIDMYTIVEQIRTPVSQKGFFLKKLHFKIMHWMLMERKKMRVTAWGASNWKAFFFIALSKLELLCLATSLVISWHFWSWMKITHINKNSGHIGSHWPLVVGWVILFCEETTNGEGVDCFLACCLAVCSYCM